MSPPSPPKDANGPASKSPASGGAPAKSRATDAGAERRSMWLVSPSADVILGAGAWSLPVLLIAGWAAANAGPWTTFAFYALALVVNYPHFAATVVRAYRGRPSHRLVTIWFTVLLVGVLIGAHLVNDWLPYIFAVYLTWSPWHYTSQNRGIATLFLRRAGVVPTDRERRVLRGAFLASFLMWGLGLHSGPSLETLARLDLDPTWTLPARLVCLGVFVGAALYLFGAWFGRANDANAEDQARQKRGILVAAVVVSTQLLWFGLPWALESAGMLQLTPIYFAAGALALMHGAQYLWVIFFTERTERQLAGQRFSAPRHFALLVGVGSALFLLGPWVVSRGAQYDLVTSFLLFQALVNIHHFAVDGVIWRLREPKVAAVFDAKERGQGKAPADQSGGGLSPLKLVGVAVLVLAVAVAVVDVIQYASTQAGATEEQLAVAEKLNPQDPRIFLRRAEAAMRESQPEVALKHLEAGLGFAPQSGPLLRAKATVLAQQEAFEKAYAHLQSLPERMQNVETLVHLAALAHRLKKPDEARKWIAKAADQAPNDPEVLRHRGRIELDQDQKREAAENFRLSLVQTAKRVHNVRGDDVIPSDALIGNTPDTVTLDVACDLAHLWVQMKKYDDAERLLKVITQTAVRVGSPLHAMRAVGDASRVHTARGQRIKGLLSLQRALKIAKEVDAPLEEAELWMTLASTLDAFDAPLALRFAATLQANNLGQNVQVFDGLRAFRMRKAILGNMGRIVDATDKEIIRSVRNNLDGFLNEALAWRAN